MWLTSAVEFALLAVTLLSGTCSSSFFSSVKSLRPLSFLSRPADRRNETQSTQTNLALDKLSSEEVLTQSADQPQFDYDLIVIGGGSGGLAAAKEAKKLGMKVAVLDYVKPSPVGSKWGLGGTCVNVGCIPKKLMHTAALMGELIKESTSYGWQLDTDLVKHSWVTMKNSIQSHIKKLNFGYKGQLRTVGVDYLNKLGKFVGQNEIECTDGAGNVETLTSRNFIIAVGGRPTPLECIGGELAISSDDLFSMEATPGRTCVVGAGYVALECAGFLSGLHQGEVAVLVRSVPLRSFDRDVVSKVLKVMNEAVTILEGVTPTSIERIENGQLRVVFSNGGSDVFDTVLAAVGRRADTTKLGLESAGVITNPFNGKILCVNEQTSTANIYAVGDVVEGAPELTPVAIHAGKLLVRRLYSESLEMMNYKDIATTVFTPLELGTVGLTEEEAVAMYGSDSVDSYAAEFEPLEWTLSHKYQDIGALCYIKIIVNREDSDRILGMHIAAPNAGEIIQGFALAFKKGITYKDLLDTVGVHPTIAEQFTMLEVSKSSGKSLEKASC